MGGGIKTPETVQYPQLLKQEMNVITPEAGEQERE